MLVRNSIALPATANQQLYDMGNFQVITQGMQSAYTVGELWVTYHVKFSKPRITPAPAGMYMHVIEQPVNTASNSNPLGTATLPLVTSDSNLPGCIPVANNSIQVPQPGNYVAIVYWVGATFSDRGAFTLGTNMTGIVCANNSATSQDGISTSGKMVSFYFFTVTAAGITSANRIALGGPSGAVTSTSDYFIMALPSAVN